MKKKVWIWDVETLSIFTATFLDKNSDEVRTFVLTDTINEIPQMLEFLSKEVAGLVGYNSLHFDAQILEYIYKNNNCTAQDIKEYANLIINSFDRQPDVPEWKLKDKHLDLYKALSLSTKSKRTGLKWCEFSMDLENIEDMPEEITLEGILQYNLNDVIATKELYLRYYHEIDLRKKLTEREGINLLNCTEPDLAKKLFSKYLSKAMCIPQSELKDMYTNRPIVKVKDIIFPCVQFKTEKFQNVLKSFNELELNEWDKPEFIVNHGIDIVFGLGGIHASPNNVVVESNNDYIIKSCDVISYYPNLAIRNKICAEHLPKEIFLNLYEGFFNERRNIPKSDPRNYILKILLNAAYGLSNDKYSFLRDRQVTLTICINGQLLLTQLMEDIILQIPEAKLIMMNTDGFEVKIPRAFESIYNNICDKWQKLTNLELEFIDYNKMIISDVNNYIAVDVNGKIKTKGKYEYKNIPLHKNKSHSIIPKAVHDYWVYNTLVETTIKNHNNIFDFCAGVKSKKSELKGNAHYEMWKVIKGQIVKEKLSKTVRYFISKKGGTLIKFYETGDYEQVEAPVTNGKQIIKDWKITYFNKSYKLDNFEEYQIDYSYYISKAKKWINDIEQIGQHKLI
jgi:hypothetical protein